MALNEYLDALLEALHQLGVANAYQIVARTEKEIQDRLGSQTLESVLDALGTPQQYARRIKDVEDKNKETTVASRQQTTYGKPFYQTRSGRNTIIIVLIVILGLNFLRFVLEMVFGLFRFGIWGIGSVLGSIFHYGGNLFLIGVIVVLIAMLLNKQRVN